MINRSTIEFKKRNTVINELVTKFGGQPNWLEEPQWPISSELNSPMRFICQIKLTEDNFPGSGGKIAYIFMTEDEEYVDGTWEPDGGENAIIIQPGGIPQVKVQSIETGPTLQNYIEVSGESKLLPENVELEVILHKSTDPEYIEQNKLYDMPEDQAEAYSEKVAGNKIGGTPGFLQNDEFPSEGECWKLLLQLDSCGVPFSVNFGDSGISYAFINEDATVGKFLWQCC